MTHVCQCYRCSERLLPDITGHDFPLLPNATEDDRIVCPGRDHSSVRQPPWGYVSVSMGLQGRVWLDGENVTQRVVAAMPGPAGWVLGVSDYDDRPSEGGHLCACGGDLHCLAQRFGRVRTDHIEHPYCFCRPEVAHNEIRHNDQLGARLGLWAVHGLWPVDEQHHGLPLESIGVN